MSNIALTATDLHVPETFRVRGAAVPFTTPLLAGTRVRSSARGSIELVVCNPSGSRGVYVVQWAGVRALCTPTIHDRILIDAIAGLTQIDPGSVREAALSVALDGYAGPEAAAAAEAARDSDLAERHLMQFLLLSAIVEQTDRKGQRLSMLAERTPEFNQRAAVVLAQIAAQAECSPARTAAGVSTLGNAFASVGLRQDDRPGRVSRLMAKVARTDEELSAWLAADSENDLNGMGRAVTGAMRGTYQVAQAVLVQTRARLADPTALLERWITNANEILELASRCEWLLDGWERICLLWTIANSDPERRGALVEMTQLLPMLPREAAGWVSVPIPQAAIEPTCRVTSRMDAWRVGAAALSLTARNETLRAMSL